MHSISEFERSEAWPEPRPLRPSHVDRPEAAWYDLDTSPVLLVAADGFLVGANRAGRRLLAQGSLATLHGGQLRFGDADGRRAFQACLDDVLQHRAEHAAVVLRGDDGEWRRLELSCCVGRERPLAFVACPSDRPRRDLTAIVEAFGLTQGEARVLQHVADGFEPKRVASLLGVSTSTVRNHLRSLYSKMHVRNLRGLVRLCIRLTM